MKRHETPADVKVALPLVAECIHAFESARTRAWLCAEIGDWDGVIEECATATAAWNGLLEMASEQKRARMKREGKRAATATRRRGGAK